MTGLAPARRKLEPARILARPSVVGYRLELAKMAPAVVFVVRMPVPRHALAGRGSAWP